MKDKQDVEGAVNPVGALEEDDDPFLVSDRQAAHSRGEGPAVLRMVLPQADLGITNPRRVGVSCAETAAQVLREVPREQGGRQGCLL